MVSLHRLGWPQSCDPLAPRVLKLQMNTTRLWMSHLADEKLSVHVALSLIMLPSIRVFSRLLCLLYSAWAKRTSEGSRNLSRSCCLSHHPALSSVLLGLLLVGFHFSLPQQSILQAEVGNCKSYLTECNFTIWNTPVILFPVAVGPLFLRQWGSHCRSH